MLERDGFSLFETVAVARNVDDFSGPSLQPTDARKRGYGTNLCRAQQLRLVTDVNRGSPAAGNAYWLQSRGVMGGDEFLCSETIRERHFNGITVQASRSRL